MTPREEWREAHESWMYTVPLASAGSTVDGGLLRFKSSRWVEHRAWKRLLRAVRPRCRVCRSRRCLSELEHAEARGTRWLLRAVAAEGRLSRAIAAVSWMDHAETCARHDHADCGLTSYPDGVRWRCWEGLSREACEAAPCDCGLTELETTLGGVR